jgi:hypothetical protein
MIGPPRLWTTLVTGWCPLPASLAWVWWRALVRTHRQASVEWREAFLTFARRQDTEFIERDLICTFLMRHCTPRDLIALLEALIEERVLLPRDGHRIEEALLVQCDAHRKWKHSSTYEPATKEKRGL